MIEIQEATKSQAAEIASLIMTAMTDDCCLYFWGIARKLLWATKERASRLDLPCVGLLVDKDNPVGEVLYTSVGFQYVNDNQWGGHPMKHPVL